VFSIRSVAVTRLARVISRELCRIEWNLVPLRVAAWRDVPQIECRVCSSGFSIGLVSSSLKLPRHLRRLVRCKNVSFAPIVILRSNIRFKCRHRMDVSSIFDTFCACEQKGGHLAPFSNLSLGKWL